MCGEANFKGKIKRLALIIKYEDGVVKMPHPESLIKTKRIANRKRYLDDNSSLCKLLLLHYLKNVETGFREKSWNDFRKKNQSLSDYVLQGIFLPFRITGNCLLKMERIITIDKIVTEDEVQDITRMNLKINLFHSGETNPDSSEFPI